MTGQSRPGRWPGTGGELEFGVGPTLRGDPLPLPPRTRSRTPSSPDDGVEDPADAHRPPSVAEQVLDVVASIPPGRVLTYGDIAGRLGLGSPRQVGHVLSGDLLTDAEGSVPWHRVVRADGTLAEHIAAEQGRRLRAEGVAVSGGRLRLADHRWTRDESARRGSTGDQRTGTAPTET